MASGNAGSQLACDQELNGLKQERGMQAGTVEYVIASTSLGEALVAGTAEGVSAVLLGDDGAELLRSLAARWRRARFVAGGAAFRALAARAVAAVEDPGAAGQVPLALAGTPFQRAVWDALRAVPTGTTVSYAELARRIGRPGAVRAVGQAVGANAVAVIVPCHRAIRSDGSLSGYRWGVERKRELLAREATSPGR
jgi:AraC family transcriptional regulator of adaptative response/methylated-DNA-[protein]-cysteine methyltransferase